MNRLDFLGNVRNYNGKGNWSVEAVQTRYREYCDAHVDSFRSLDPKEAREGDVLWIYPIMREVIQGIEEGDVACIALGVRRQLLFPLVLPHLEMLPKVWKYFLSDFDLSDGVKQSTGRSFMQHTEAGWRSGGGLCWRTTRQGIANWRLIHGDGRRHAAEDRASIAWIDFRMPRKTHGYCRRAAASLLS